MSDGIQAFQEQVRAFAAVHGLFSSVERLRIGFSGGPDSTALTLVLAAVFPRLEAVHLHHRLRGAAADGDAEWCARFCRERGIPFSTAALDVLGCRRPGESLEAAARRCRLEYWRRTTLSGQAVALGHHADDCLEDLLIRLSRGANAGGLTGLRPLRTINGVRLVRPLLGLRRQDIEAFLEAQGVRDCRDDASNADTRMRRNAVRALWLPLIRQTVGHDQGLLRSLEALRQDADCLDDYARRESACVGSRAALQALHPALLPRVLRLWLQERTGQDVVVPRAAVLRLREALSGAAAGATRVPLRGGMTVELSEAGLRLVLPGGVVAARVWDWRRDPVLHLPEVGLSLAAEPGVCVGLPAGASAGDGEVFLADQLPNVLGVRSWRPGDRMVPFGGQAATKLQDLFVNARIPRAQRLAMPVVTAGEAIVWVPGLRRAEFARAVEGAQSVRLTARPFAGEAPREKRADP